MRKWMLRTHLLAGLFLGLFCLSGVCWSQDATVNLESTVTGNQEQPNVLYIIPWKAPSGPDDLYQTLNSQLDTVFAHVERAELKRELRYLQTFSQQEQEKE